MKYNRKWLEVDIECSADVAEVYGSRYEPKIVRYLSFSKVTGFAVKWFEGSKIWVFDLEDFGGSETRLLKKLSWWIEQCDYFIAHNGDKFDLKVINARLDSLSLNQIPPTKTIDTLKIARKLWRVPSYSLDSLGQYFELGRKTERPRVEGKMTQAERRMEKKYNGNDVLLLHKLFVFQLPHIGHMAPFKVSKNSQSTKRQCPQPYCNSYRNQSRGQKINNEGIWNQYQCQDCWKWFYILNNNVVK